MAQPAAVTVAVVSYIPTLGGYYTHSLDVLKVCLNSIWENTRTPFDLLVFDNASCSPVRQYLREAQEAGRIQYLVLSEKNYGKSGAWNFIFGAAPGEYIAYADSDVYHYPGWLQAQLAVLDRFPGVGMVTGMPMWTPEDYSTATVEWAEQAPEVDLQRGMYLPWEDYWRHARSLGAEETNARAHYDTTENLVVQSDGKQYYIGAAHFQFVAPKQVLSSLLPIPSDRPMGQVRNLDIALNQQGYLRLCTSEWWVRHMGNTLEDLPSDLQSSPIPRTARGFWQWKLPRRLATWLYHWTFQVLYRNPSNE